MISRETGASSLVLCSLGAAAGMRLPIPPVVGTAAEATWPEFGDEGLNSYPLAPQAT